MKFSKNKYYCLFVVLMLLGANQLNAQCLPLGTIQSNRVADYKMAVVLDHNKKMASGTSEIVWRNPSPNPVSTLKMYMYLNSFKNMNSTWLKASNGRVFRQDLMDRKPIEWGYVDITRIITDQGVNLTDAMKYVQADGNQDDESVLEIILPESVAVGDSIVLNLDFEAKLPKTIARSGYGGNNFHLFVHWYPKMGVYEQDVEGQWGWNCHQFMQNTEFYGDFGKYEVEITCAEEFTVGASGCRVKEQQNGDGTQTLTYLAEDMIDFAWTVSPELEEYLDEWEGIKIRLLIGPDHCSMADRYIQSIKNALEFFDQHLGRYPYPGITITDPPFHSLRNGFMEYPSFITAGSVYGMPSWFKGSESLAIHEFAHQFFMAVLASNEKEEAWLDEGFVTYYEDRIMEHYYGQNTSQFDVLGYKYGNSALSRNEYVSIAQNQNTTIALPGWEIQGNFKGIVYAKTATMLKTLERYMGAKQFDEMMKEYWTMFKFTHPRKEDFLNTLDSHLGMHFDEKFQDDILGFVDQCLHTDAWVDYRVYEVSEQKVAIRRYGDLFIPVTFTITLADGQVHQGIYDASSTEEIIEFDQEVFSVEIDPEQKLFMDVDLNNNTWVKKPTGFTKYLTLATNWMQHGLQSLSFIF